MPKRVERGRPADGKQQTERAKEKRGDGAPALPESGLRLAFGGQFIGALLPGLNDAVDHAVGKLGADFKLFAARKPA